MPSSFIIVAIILSIFCAAFILWPVLRLRAKNPPVPVIFPVVFMSLTLVGAYWLYTQNSEWNWQEAGVPDNPAAQKLYELQADVHERPEDHKAWLELAQFYLQFEQLPPAKDALNRAIELTDGGDVEINLTMVEALSVSANAADQSRMDELIKASLRIDPNHRKALWYGGEIAASQQKYDVAIVRWTRLLEDSQKLASPEAQSVTQLLTERIATARGLLSAPSSQEAIIVKAEIDTERAGELPQNTAVFILARAYEQAGPPLAVHRTTISELPLTVTLSDQNAMLPTRKLSDFESVEIVVRASLSGTPMAQAGDYFGSALVGPDTERSVSVVIGDLFE